MARQLEASPSQCGSAKQGKRPFARVLGLSTETQILLPAAIRKRSAAALRPRELMMALVASRLRADGPRHGIRGRGPASLATVVIGGLVTWTALTLFVRPAVYGLFRGADAGWDVSR